MSINPQEQHPRISRRKLLYIGAAAAGAAGAALAKNALDPIISGIEINARIKPSETQPTQVVEQTPQAQQTAVPKPTEAPKPSATVIVKPAEATKSPEAQLPPGWKWHENPSLFYRAAYPANEFKQVLNLKEVSDEMNWLIYQHIGRMEQFAEKKTGRYQTRILIANNVNGPDDPAAKPYSYTDEFAAIIAASINTHYRSLPRYAKNVQLDPSYVDPAKYTQPYVEKNKIMVDGFPAAVVKAKFPPIKGLNSSDMSYTEVVFVTKVKDKLPWRDFHIALLTDASVTQEHYNKYFLPVLASFKIINKA